MICFKADIPSELCGIDDELKAIYHSHDSVCIYVFKAREDRNRFVDDTVGMLNQERETFFSNFYEWDKKQLSIF